jgi:eukaryotic-like serine/threonine-protein kinase
VANDPHFLFSHAAGALSVIGGDTSDGGELALVPGLVLGNKYCLLRPAGFGGMGAVWVARNEATSAEVALKVLVTARQGVDAEAIARFRREAHTAAQLYHRGIVRIFDLVELRFTLDEADSAIRLAATGEPRTPDALVLVMELLRGETLASHMDKKRRFSQEETLAIVLPLLSALAHAHAQGIVHRDLKPENVFLSVDPDGHVIPKILDFGISKLLQPAAPRITTDGAMLGTPSYMSPEQARGLSNVDARADVFSAGILLYECLSGENPFSSGSYHSVVAAILERDPEPLKFASPEVWRVIKRALEKPVDLRYADAGELASALLAAAQSAGVASPDASGAYPARGSMADRSVPPAGFREPDATSPSIYVEAKKRKRARATIGAVVLACALAGAAGLYVRSAHSPAANESFTAAPPAAATVEPGPPAPSPGLVALPPSSAAQASPSVEEPPVIPPASAASGAAIVTVSPMAPDPAGPAVSHPRAAPRPSPPAAAHPKAPSASVAAPAASPAAPASAAPPRSTVVRDPGF